MLAVAVQCHQASSGVRRVGNWPTRGQHDRALPMRLLHGRCHGNVRICGKLVASAGNSISHIPALLGGAPLDTVGQFDNRIISRFVVPVGLWNICTIFLTDCYHLMETRRGWCPRTGKSVAKSNPLRKLPSLTGCQGHKLAAIKEMQCPSESQWQDNYVGVCK